jgi:hypothetical protein
MPVEEQGTKGERARERIPIPTTLFVFFAHSSVYPVTGERKGGRAGSGESSVVEAGTMMSAQSREQLMQEIESLKQQRNDLEMKVQGIYIFLYNFILSLIPFLPQQYN